MSKYDELAQIINKSKKLVFFTGAGISVPSGIPDFRSADGLYNQSSGYNYRPEEIISHHFFEEHPDMFYEFYLNKMVYLNAKPNYAHKLISSLDNKSRLVSVVTQNIDGLHSMAGSKRVFELHGSIYRNFCIGCNQFYSLEEMLKLGDVPHCKECGDIVKPDVVLYEEGLDEETIRGAIEAISDADTMIIIGTSLAVYPAASFVNYFRGNNLILINKEKTQYDHICSLVFNEDVINVFNQIKDNLIVK